MQCITMQYNAALYFACTHSITYCSGGFTLSLTGRSPYARLRVGHEALGLTPITLRRARPRISVHNKSASLKLCSLASAHARAPLMHVTLQCTPGSVAALPSAAQRSAAQHSTAQQSHGLARSPLRALRCAARAGLARPGPTASDRCIWPVSCKSNQ